MSRGWFPDRRRKYSICWSVDTEKSICVQRLEMESNKFLHDRQTCVIMIRGLFIGHDSHLSSRVKKWGMRTKISFGSRFIGCKIDSSVRSFGTTFVSKELLTAVTYEHGRESGVMMRLLKRIFFIAYLCNRYTTIVASAHSVSIHCD